MLRSAPPGQMPAVSNQIAQRIAATPAIQATNTGAAQPVSKAPAAKQLLGPSNMAAVVYALTRGKK